MKNFLKKFKIKRKLIAFLASWHFFGNPSKDLKIIGVTGTNGKTTVATLLYKITKALGYKVGLISTVDILINGEEFKMERKIPTTPDVLALNKIFREMKKKQCTYVFMEISSHSMDQNRIAGIKFTGGIFTNLTQDHLDYHKNFDNYFLAKKKFFKILPKNSFTLSNIDDKYGQKIVENIKARKYFYGFSDISFVSDISETRERYFYGKILKSNFTGLNLLFNGEEIKSKLLGKFNAYNLLAVWSACHLLGFDMKKVKEIIKEISPPNGRFEYFISPDEVIIIVDYAHTPDALEKVLSTAKEIQKSTQGKLISIVGCGGDRDSLKRPKMGKIGTTYSDISIFTSDNPRNEDPEKIIFEMKTGLTNKELKKIITISNRRLAIREAVKLAEKGDIILCAGKGHETYQEIKGKKYHFNDMEEFKKVSVTRL